MPKLTAGNAALLFQEGEDALPTLVDHYGEEGANALIAKWSEIGDEVMARHGYCYPATPAAIADCIQTMGD